MEVDQDKRLNWEETLSHRVFIQEEVSLPEFFIPEKIEEFFNLGKMEKDENLKNEKIEESLNSLAQ